MSVNVQDLEIIFIDDNRAELLLAEEAIKEIEKFILKTFDDASLAYKYISENSKRIFLIISDINMPRLSGIELLGLINADYDLKMEAIPFIFLSNSGNTEDIEKAYALAA